MSAFTFNMPRRLKGMMAKLPLMIDCVEFEQFLLDYMDGALTRKQLMVFEMHLRFCRECREYLRAFEAARDLAQSVGSSEVEIPGDVPDDLIEAVADALGKRSE